MNSSCVVATVSGLSVVLLVRARWLEKQKITKLEFKCLEELEVLEDAAKVGLVVDCVHANLPAITHHRVRGEKKVDDLVGDTSTALVLDAVRKKHPVLENRRFVSCNHYDADALLSLIPLIDQKFALRHEALFREAAKIGDFREFDYERFRAGDELVRKALRLCCVLNTMEREHARPFEGVEGEKLKFFMANYENIFRQAKNEEMETVNVEYERVLRDCETLYDPTKTTVTYLDEISLVIVETPNPVHYYSLFSLSKSCDNILTIYDQQKYELEQRYTTFVELCSRPVLPRVCLTKLAKQLNALGLEQPGNKWVGNRFVDSGPLLRLNHEGGNLSKAERYGHPFERPILSSAIAPTQMKELVVQFFHNAYVNVKPGPSRSWSWAKLHEFNRSEI